MIAEICEKIYCGNIERLLDLVSFCSLIYENSWVSSSISILFPTKKQRKNYLSLSLIEFYAQIELISMSWV